MRIAVGARRVDILGLVVRDGSKSLAPGATFGLLLAVALHYVMAAMIEIVEPRDYALFAGSFAALTLTALVALVVPAS